MGFANRLSFAASREPVGSSLPTANKKLAIKMGLDIDYEHHCSKHSLPPVLR